MLSASGRIMDALHLVPLELYLSLPSDARAEALAALEEFARQRWVLQALVSGLAPAWPSVVATVTPWGVHVRGMLWRPGLQADAAP